MEQESLEFSWTPRQPTDQARIRIVQDNQVGLDYDHMSGVFVVTPLTTSASDIS